MAGFSLVTAALVLIFSRRTGRIADLVLLAALAWFATVWIGWQEGPALARGGGMVVSGLWFPLLFHATLAFPTGRVSSRAARVFVLVVYAEWFVSAALLALVRDPYSDPGCWSDCYAVNPFLVHSAPALVRTVETTGRWFAVAAAAVLVFMLAWRLLRGSAPARLAIGPVAAPGILLAGAVGAHAIALERIAVEDPTRVPFEIIFIATASALILIGAGLAFAALRTRSQRLAIGRMVGNLGEAPAPGSLEAALAEALGDPALRIAYWLPGAQRYVDGNGQTVGEPAAAPGRVLTTLAHGEQPMAIVSHAGSHPDLEREMGPAVRLGLETERLQAEVLARLEEIRQSRARIVETGDAERRRLERNLHDGAQQRLLALSYEIGLARAAGDADGDGDAKSVLAEAVAEAKTALAELRELAHGIFPAILAEAGLRPALETFADSMPIPVSIGRMAEDRLSPAVEMAAYLLVVEASEDALARGATRLEVEVVHERSRLLVTAQDDGSPRTASMIAVADRVGAIGGTVEVEQNLLRAAVPVS
jgi:signal transduction histidine kinase